MNEEMVRHLIQEAKAVMVNSYSPYSKFPVGAALLCADGTIYKGCNIENAAYSQAICAERTAYAKAISEGKRYFSAIAITSEYENYIVPCGTCRQFMVEFGLDLKVITTKKDATYEICSLQDLIPKSFGPSTLREYQATSES